MDDSFQQPVTLTCPKCRQEKGVEDFPSNGGRVRTNECRACLAKWSRDYYHSSPERRAASLAKNRAYREANWEQRRADKARWDQENLEPNRHKARMKNYGVTPEQYEQMLAEQGGLCAACGNPETVSSRAGSGPRPLCVDHDHETGAIRGLLCSRCNSALGLLNDDPNRLLMLVDYLKRTT